MREDKPASSFSVMIEATTQPFDEAIMLVKFSAEDHEALSLSGEIVVAEETKLPLTTVSIATDHTLEEKTFSSMPQRDLVNTNEAADPARGHRDGEEIQGNRDVEPRKIVSEADALRNRKELLEPHEKPNDRLQIPTVQDRGHTLSVTEQFRETSKDQRILLERPLEGAKAEVSDLSVKRSISEKLNDPSSSPSLPPQSGSLPVQGAAETVGLEELSLTPPSPAEKRELAARPISATPSSSSPPLQNTAASSVTNQFVATLSTSEAGATEILLDPEDLGKVRLTLMQTDGRQVLLIEVQRAETAELLRRNLDDLAAEFKEAGYEGLTFEFGENRQGWEDKTEPANIRHISAGDDHETEQTPRVTVPTDRLDLRL